MKNSEFFQMTTFFLQSFFLVLCFEAGETELLHMDSPCTFSVAAFPSPPLFLLIGRGCHLVSQHYNTHSNAHPATWNVLNKNIIFLNCLKVTTLYEGGGSDRKWHHKEKL